MNFIEAHKIVHDYGSALAKGTDKNALIFRPNSHLNNTKDEIIDAYKIFYAHMVLFNTRTQKEYEQYEACRKFLNHFVDDALYNLVIENERFLSKNSLFQNANEIEEAKQLQKQYMDAISDSISKGYYRNDEMKKFFNDAQEIALKFKAGISKLDLNDEKDFGQYTNDINSYAFLIYAIANIDLHANDLDFFFPFPLLQRFCKVPQYKDVFGKYSNYIVNNR